MNKKILTIYPLALAICVSAENLIPNGNFEIWGKNTPNGWIGTDLSCTVNHTEYPGMKGLCIKGSAKNRGKLSVMLPKLKTNTEYVLSFYLYPGNITGMIAGVPSSVFRIGVPYMHRSGFRYYYKFRTPDRFKTQPQLLIHCAAENTVISNVILNCANAEWNRGIFVDAGKNKAECVFTVANPCPQKQMIKAEMNLSDFNGKILFSKNVSCNLKSNEEKQFRIPFTTGDVKRYRAILKFNGKNGYSGERWTYFNQNVVKGIRKQWNLADGWQFQYVTEDSRPAEKEYQSVSLPHSMQKTKKADGYYRLTVKSPCVLKNGERLFLHLYNAVSSPSVYINSRLAGTQTGRGDFRVDVSPFWNSRKENEILVVCKGSGNVYVPQPQGGSFFRLPYTHGLGMVDQAVLELEPAVTAGGLKIETSLTEKILKVRGELYNDSVKPGMYTVRQMVLDNGKKVFSLPETKHWLVPKERTTFRQSILWEKPHLYFPHDPHLYLLVTELLDSKGKIVDRLNTRFGFREISIKGKDVFMNGIRARFISRLSLPYYNHAYKTGGGNGIDSWMNRSREIWELYQSYGITYARSYGFDGRLMMCGQEILDEMGMITRSSLEMNIAMTDYRGKTEDSPLFRDSHVRYTERYVRAFWNHPSIIMWDMENETFLCSSHLSYPFFHDLFRTLRAVVRGLDTTRPLMHDSADPMAESDVASLHYPFEITRHQPNTEQFPLIPFEKNKLYTNLNLHPGIYCWDEKRPLMVGEDLIDLCEQPQSLSHYADEFVYQLGGRRMPPYPGIDTVPVYKEINKALQILGREYRKRGLHVVTTWAVVNEMHKDEFARDAVVIDEYHRNFYAGETVQRNYTFFHDPMFAFDARINWNITLPNGKKVSEGSQDLHVPGGEIMTGRFILKFPDVKKQKNAVIHLSVSDRKNGKIIAAREFPVRIMPHHAIKIPSGVKIALYDPEHNTSAMFDRMKIPYTKVSKPEPAADCTLFVIGRNGASGLKHGFDSFMKKGGVVLVMEQCKGVPEVFPVRLVPQNGLFSRTAYPRAVGHPLTLGIPAEELQYWRGADSLVSTANYAKPTSGNAVAVFDGGSMGGYTVSPLIEITCGKGRAIFSQFRLTDKAGKDFAADKLLQNLLDYAAKTNFFPADQKLYFCGTDEMKRLLESCGVKPVPFTEKSKGLLLLDARYTPSGDEKKKIIIFARNGGLVWLQGINQKNAARFEDLTGKLTFSKEARSAVLKTGNNVLLPGLTNTDLYWFGVPEYDFYGKIYDEVGMGNIIVNPPLPLKEAEQLVLYGALQKKKFGKGSILLDALHWPESLQRLPMRAPRIPNAILNACGIHMLPAAFDRPLCGKTEFKTLSLKALFNQGLNGELPSGKKILAGIPYDISGKGRGALMLGSSILMQPKVKIPIITKPVKVGYKFSRLHLLSAIYNPYTAGRGFGTGESIGAVVLNYADETFAVLPIIQKVHGANLFELQGDLPAAKVAWQGINPFSNILSWYTIYSDDEWIQTSGINTLYSAVFQNPYPEKDVETIVFRSANQHYVPIIFAATTEGK